MRGKFIRSDSSIPNPPRKVSSVLGQLNTTAHIYGIKQLTFYNTLSTGKELQFRSWISSSNFNKLQHFKYQQFSTEEDQSFSGCTFFCYDQYTEHGAKLLTLSLLYSTSQQIRAWQFVHVVPHGVNFRPSPRTVLKTALSQIQSIQNMTKKIQRQATSRQEIGQI